eukprot:64697-Chlamydomonas_euryale.AAC.2
MPEFATGKPINPMLRAISAMALNTNVSPHPPADSTKKGLACLREASTVSRTQHCPTLATSWSCWIAIQPVLCIFRGRQGRYRRYRGYRDIDLYFVWVGVDMTDTPFLPTTKQGSRAGRVAHDGVPLLVVTK